MSSRHIARAITLQSLFMWDFNGEDTQNLPFYIDYNVQEFAPREMLDKEFIRDLAEETILHKQEIDERINRYTKEWPVHRLAILDRNILRIAMYEIFYRKEVPPKVALNEAVELAKQYSGASAQKFVSGVLGSMYEEYFKKPSEQSPGEEPPSPNTTFETASQSHETALDSGKNP